MRKRRKSASAEKREAKDRGKKSAYQELAEEIIRPAKEKQEARDRAKRKKSKSSSAEADSGARKARPKLRMGDPKMVAKDIRKAMKKMPKLPKNPYAALMAPMVIVPDSRDEKPVVADAGTVVRLMDQSNLYRDWMSPVTRRADELLVQYGKADKPKMGWLSQRDPTNLKPSKGPTFLVSTKDEDQLIAWEQIRLKIARARKAHPDSVLNWIAPWLVNHGPKHPKLLREVTRYFGGKPIKNEEFDVRVGRLFSLILNVELDMASLKTKEKKGKKSSKKQNRVEEERPVKKSKKGKKEKSSKKENPAKKEKKSTRLDDDRLTSKHNDYIIKRLSQENPRRVGTHKHKIWSRLKKGMTVKEFCEKGDGCSKTELRAFRRNGWIKLLRPKGAE